MAHRSDQAVASQARALPPPEAPPPPPRRLLVGWATALTALAASTALVGLGLWLARVPIAEFFLSAALAERGAEADFQITRLGLSGATLGGVRLGSETSPDVAIGQVEARWRWRGLSPQLRALRLVAPRVRLRIDPSGRVSAGALDRLQGPPSARRLQLPQITVEIVDGEAVIEAPFGRLTADIEGAGTLGRDFSARAQIAETSHEGDSAYALGGGVGELIVVSRDDAIALRLAAGAQRLVWSGARFEDASVRVIARGPLDLSRLEVESIWRVASVRADGIAAQRLNGAANLEALAREDALAPATWAGQANASAADLTLAGNAMRSIRFDARAAGDSARGEGRWTLGLERFAGLALVSERPSAAGDFAVTFGEDATLAGEARAALAQSRLDPDAQARVRAAFPELGGAPVGPTFAQAEHALDAAADRFDLDVPLTVDADESGVRVRVESHAQARAATGAMLRLTPLREDAPALVLQWPGPALHGAIALELSGGGAPNASLLLDTLSWSPDAPFDADGTLTLARWQAGEASIAADELGVTLSLPPGGGGRLDLRGPARVTGPLGQGQVRNLVASLDLAVHWGGGWRVVPNSGCLPMRLGGLDAAGLSFTNGAFALCPLGGALIAADARRALSGGFVVQRVALDGRMAGPGAQPARLSAADVVGRFGGRTGDVILTLEAETPRLAIEMAEDRTLAVTMQRITADTHLTEGWRVDGAFEHGTLSDPALPGSVSTIAGRWSAAPEDDKPVIRVDAGEALLTANRPATDAERPLFNPLRLREVGAVLREGHVDADGLILLEDRARQLAHFTAQHDVSRGVGAAQVTAQDLAFGPALQPYEITERARGLIENVRGPASLVADIDWTRERIDGVGRLRLDGVSASTATIPIIRDVRGEIYFDDLFALTTPPGQEVRVGLINPGVAVTNGRVRFQLLPEQRVAIEQAEFDFASGVLAMSPTTIKVGADETRFELTLRDVDAASLVSTLNIPDLTASGRVEGSFPLVLTRRTAFIEHGVLRARAGGGDIAYTGQAGAGARGPARVAFDALQSFRYHELVLTLDGDLSGEVVSSIEFHGENTGRPVDLGPIAPVPGIGNVAVRGVPFEFHVRITAPFRALARTAASLTDPGIILERARNGAEENEAVDPEAPPPR